MSAPVQTTPWFLRAWNVTLNTQAGQTVVLSSDTQAQPLRVTFRLEMQANTAYWICDVTIYNVNADFANTLQATGIASANTSEWQYRLAVSLGDKLSISAGYKYGPNGPFDPQSNLIWQGTVFQPLWTRQDVVDYTITLRCYVGLAEDALNFVSCPVGTAAAPPSQADIVKAIMANAGIQAEGETSVDFVTLANANKYPTGVALFSRPYALLANVAKENHMQCWISPRGLNLRSLKFDPNITPDIAYSPPNLGGGGQLSGQGGVAVKPTILGVPVQTQDGVSFRVLLDAQPRIGSIVQILPGTIISQLAVNPLQLRPVPNPTGIYAITGIRHVGDTRGQGEDWYTEIRAVNQQFFPPIGIDTPNVGS